MSFLRHREIYRPMWPFCAPSLGATTAAAPTHRLDEFPAGYSSAGCAPAEPASASPAGKQYALQSFCRSRIFQRTANSVLTVCVSSGGKRRAAREELRDLLLPVVIRAFGSVEHSLDLLLKESPRANGHGIKTLIKAYALFCLRAKREATEARDQASEERFAEFVDQFDELTKRETKLFGANRPHEHDRIHATLRTSVCNLPAINCCPPNLMVLFQGDASERPLGDNPFPEGHLGHDAFEEATWSAKRAIGQLRADFRPPYSGQDLLNSIYRYRTRYFNVLARESMCIVGNDETARRYESWINDSAEFFIGETMRKLRLQPPGVDPAVPPFLQSKDLEHFERDFTLEVFRIVNHYKTEAASRVLEIRQRLARRDGTQPVAKSQRERGCDVKGGRPSAEAIFGEKVRELRGALSQRAFSRLTKLSIDVIQRAEQGEATVRTMQTICRHAKSRNLELTVTMLRKNRPQKTAKT